jgi:hypothetical protein
MRCHRKNYRHPGRKPLRLWFLHGFVALTCYFLLPLIFSADLSAFPPSASQEDREDYSLIIWSNPERARSRHSVSGPLYQAEDISQDYAYSALPQTPDGSCLAQPLGQDGPHRPVTFFPLLASGPRAPPLSD